jgi:hypothetical protein
MLPPPMARPPMEHKVDFGRRLGYRFPFSFALGRGAVDIQASPAI